MKKQREDNHTHAQSVTHTHMDGRTHSPVSVAFSLLPVLGVLMNSSVSLQPQSGRRSARSLVRESRSSVPLSLSFLTFVIQFSSTKKEGRSASSETWTAKIEGSKYATLTQSHLEREKRDPRTHKGSRGIALHANRGGLRARERKERLTLEVRLGPQEGDRESQDGQLV